jgi:metal-responsive CopG/Arc/MetJ family transcriptional regulator
MRLRTSITLSEDLLKMIDRIDRNRSAFIQRALRDHISRLAKSDRAAKDIAIINANSERLNAEALDVLDYQGIRRATALNVEEE